MGQISFFGMWISSFPNTCVEKTVVFQFNGLGTLVEVSTRAGFTGAVIAMEA